MYGTNFPFSYRRSFLTIPGVAGVAGGGGGGGGGGGKLESILSVFTIFPELQFMFNSNLALWAMEILIFTPSINEF